MKIDYFRSTSIELDLSKILYQTILDKKLCYNSVLCLTSSAYSHVTRTGILSHKIVGIDQKDMGEYSNILFCDKYGLDYLAIPQTITKSVLFDWLTYIVKIDFRQWLDYAISKIVFNNRDIIKVICRNH